MIVRTLTDSHACICMHAQYAAKYVACRFCCALCTERASLATEQAECGGSSSLSVRLAPSGVWRLSGAANPVIGPQGSPKHYQLGSVENCMLLMECLLHDVKLSRCCIMFASACMLLHHSFGALTL
jgi:hypothetical protein